MFANTRRLAAKRESVVADLDRQGWNFRPNAVRERDFKHTPVGVELRVFAEQVARLS